jgi:hypothetical protein
MSKFIGRLLVVLALGWAGAASAATLNYEGEQVIGVNGLMVDGASWDVTFEGGPLSLNYQQPFTVPDNYADLTRSLGDFIYGGTGLERTPEVFRGCSSARQCYIGIPTSNMPPSYGFIIVYHLIIQATGYRYTQAVRGFNTTYSDVTYAHWKLTDTDMDGVDDTVDNCPDDANADQLNTDGADDGGDACDTDDDNDGWFDVDDSCPLIPNPQQEDFDGDLVGDVCDNCVISANPNQEDIDENGVGDTCEALGC